MNNNKRIETEEQLLQALEEFFCDVTEDESIEDIEKELRDLGYDPGKLEQKGIEISIRHLTNSPLNWRNTAEQAIKTARVRLDETKSQELQNLDRASLISEIQKILDTLGRKDSKLIPAHFRNFETASESDLLSILNQLQYLKSNKKNEEGE